MTIETTLKAVYDIVSVDPEFPDFSIKVCPEVSMFRFVVEMIDFADEPSFEDPYVYEIRGESKPTVELAAVALLERVKSYYLL